MFRVSFVDSRLTIRTCLPGCRSVGKIFEWDVKNNWQVDCTKVHPRIIELIRGIPEFEVIDVQGIDPEEPEEPEELATAEVQPRRKRRADLDADSGDRVPHPSFE